jgi:hypothetical protein
MKDEMFYLLLKYIFFLIIFLLEYSAFVTMIAKEGKMNKLIKSSKVN